MLGIYKRGTKWRAFASKRVDGELLQTSKTFRTQTEARVWKREMEALLDKGIDPNSGKVSFADYFGDWFQTYKANTVSDKTRTHYLQTHNLITTYFKNKPLNKLTEKDYQQFINWYAFGVDADGNEIDKPHFKETVDKVNRHCKACLKKAVRLGHLPFSPAEDVKSVGLVRKKEDMRRALGETESNELRKQLLKDFDKDNLNPIKIQLILSLATGLRYSEAMGLTWDCVNYVDETIKIEKTWDYDKSDFGPTKNESSNRVITVDSITLIYLRYLKEWQFKNGYHFNNLVFIGKELYPYSNNGVNKSLSAALKQIGINPAGFTHHNLRHTHITWLLHKRVAYTYISKRAGHQNITTTLDIYSHVVNEVEQIESKITSNLMIETYRSIGL